MTNGDGTREVFKKRERKKIGGWRVVYTSRMYLYLWPGSIGLEKQIIFQLKYFDHFLYLFITFLLGFYFSFLLVSYFEFIFITIISLLMLEMLELVYITINIYFKS